ncbi:MAG: alpha/beta hydrolase [Deltaproteobacteria bacterium]|nr:alpha/beta hydrolase [Deltaproteobacteria bacterium]
MTQPQSKYIEVQGIKLHYLEWGERGKPDLLLVHGWTSFAASWSAVAEHFQERYHVVAPDLRGHGESDKPATGYRLRDFAEDIRQLIVNLELRKPAYVGHSWGGNIATILAADSPELISCAFLEDPVYWRMLHAFMTALPGALARRNKPEAEIRAEAQQKGMSQADEDMEVYRNHHFSAQALTRLLTDNRDWALGFEDHFKRIAVPTTILIADHKVGGAIMREEMTYLQRIAPAQVKFEFWENVGHGMKAAKPVEYNQALETWLNPM